MWLLSRIKHPAEINNRALNIAWTDMWKNAKFGIFSPKHVVIRPSCLNVDKAIIFFISFSYIALIPVIKVVRMPHVIRISCIEIELWIIWLKRYIIKIPAVTSVDECTRADTGVGAAIAAGNQLE